MDEPLEVVEFGRNRVRHGTLEIGPHELVWIEFGGIAREAVKAQTRGRAQELAHKDAAVLVDVVPHDEDGSGQALEELSQESDDIWGADIAVAQEPGVEGDAVSLG